MPDRSDSDVSPLLTASSLLQQRIANAIQDANEIAKVTFEVANNDAGDGHLTGVIEVASLESINQVESVLRESLSVNGRKWRSKSPGEQPRLVIKAVIPPDVKPASWSSIVNQPTMFVVAIQATLDESELETATILRFPDDIASVALVMKGGGIKGLAYVGALEILLEHYSFDRFVGTSAGAITALLLGAGYSTKELKEILQEKDFRDFFDAPLWKKPINLLFYSGMNHANAFTDWIDVLLAEKLESQGQVSLSELPTRVTVFASRKEKPALRFDSETDDAAAAYAARCSMSIPFVFVPQQHQGFRTFDGGLQQNYPVKQLLEEDANAKFLGMYLGPEVYKPKQSRWVISDLVSIWTESHDPEFLKRYRDQTVIIDPAPIGTLDFDLSSVEKEFLLQCGRVGAWAHLGKGSKQHAAAVKTRDDLRVQVNSIRRKRKYGKRLKWLSIAMFLAFLFWCPWSPLPLAYSWAIRGDSSAESADNKITEVSPEDLPDVETTKGPLQPDSVPPAISVSPSEQELAALHKFKAMVADRLSNKQFKAEESTKKEKEIAFGAMNVSGSERGSEGSTGNAEVSVEEIENGLVAKIRLPYTANYDAKNFIGVLAEYRSDPQRCTGFAEFSVTKTGEQITLGEVTFTDVHPSISHDSSRMTTQAVRNDVIGKLITEN
ncbi:MAG: patatin-like phospholipase family protein [Planctomycetales bacterium]|nr:patatin-like phospholipase family protein [Planctomycetales bacterium]